MNRLISATRILLHLPPLWVALAVVLLALFGMASNNHALRDIFNYIIERLGN